MNSFQNTPIAVSTATLPQLDLDNFDPVVMKRIWEEYGTFELVGESINAFREAIALRAMDFSRKFLDLKNIEKLREADDQGSFHGFQDVLARTTKRVKDGANIPIRKQIAYLMKPDMFPERRVPVGIDGIDDVQMFDDYYAEAKKKILYPLYNKIADAFIAPEFRSDLSQDKGSTFGTRRYFADDNFDANINENVLNAKKIGIPSHTDFGLLTMVVTDAGGLEALTTSGEWVMAPHDPKNYKVIVNIGDWALFQAHRSGHTQFKEGIHRVMEVDKLSLIVEMNPPYAEKILTPKGVEVDFYTYLKGEKGKYRDTSRDECADTVSEAISRLKPVNPITEFPKTPVLYVTECGKSGQDPWICVNGKDYPLCSNDILDVPEKAYDNFSYAYSNPEDRQQTLLLPKQTDKFARTFEVNFKCANDIYVVDELGSREESVKTLVPLASYQGDYKKPVYLINRPLLVDEARTVSLENSNLLKFSSFKKVEMNGSEDKQADASYTFKI